MNRLLDQLNHISRFSLILCGCLVSSQVAAAWGSDSPWSKKYSAQKKQAEEEVVIDTPVVMPVAEPVMMDPEPVMAEPEPVEIEPVMAESEAMPVEEPMATTDDADIMSLSGKGYAVQVFACKSFEKMGEYQARYGLEDLTAVNTERKGKQVVVLVSLQDDRKSADNAASNLEQITGSKPWVRRLSSLQAIIVQ